jgi:hypothetical protein
MEIEYWKETSCGKYLISTHGRLFSRARTARTKSMNGKWGCRRIGGHLITMNIAPTGYQRVNMSGKVRLFHQVVAEEFLKKPADSNLVINHKDLNKLNNAVANLEWISNAENVKHAWANGAFHKQYRKVSRVGSDTVFDSLHEAAASVGLAVGNLCSHLKGRQKTFAGGTWMYVDQQPELVPWPVNHDPD